MKTNNTSMDLKKNNWYAARGTDDEINHFHFRVTSRSHLWCPPTDVYESESAVIVRVEVAGMRDADFSISLENQILIIQGARPDKPEQRAYHQIEIRFGEFKSQVELHWAIDAANIEAEYDDGFLHIVLPKALPQQIEIGEE
jgi:HSP20 family molecular chaperone IbpA